MKKLIWRIVFGVVGAILLGAILFFSLLWLIRPENRFGTPEYVFKHTYSEEKMIGMSREEIVAAYGEFDWGDGIPYGWYDLGVRDDGVKMRCRVTFKRNACIAVEYVQAPGG